MSRIAMSEAGLNVDRDYDALMDEQLHITWHSPGSIPFNDFPKAVRKNIYKFALVVPDWINLCSAQHTGKYPTAAAGHEMPNFSLLLVNKEFGGEATKYLYKQNKFVLPHEIPDDSPLVQKVDLFRHVKINFARITGNPGKGQHCSCMPWDDMVYDKSQGINIEPLPVCKKKSEIMVEENWASVAAFVQLMKLRVFEIDLSAAYCPAGDCRIAGMVPELFVSAKLKPNPFATIRAEGQSMTDLPGLLEPSSCLVVWDKVVIRSLNSAGEAYEMLAAIAPIFDRNQMDLEKWFEEDNHLEEIAEFTAIEFHPDWDQTLKHALLM